jgi:acetyl-CoA decarbonylase/synthase complex subunit gamma
LSRRLSPLAVYNSLPKKNCNECGVPTCLAFAVKLIEGTVELEACPYLTNRQKIEIEQLVLPPVRKVIFGRRKTLAVGGERVLHRHELRLYNPTAIALDLDDSEQDQDIEARLQSINDFRIERGGQAFGIDAVAVLGESKSPDRFREVVKTASEGSGLPLILCSPNPEILQAGLEETKEDRPIVYSATAETLDRLIELSKEFKCPICLTSEDLAELRAMARKAMNAGVTILLAPIAPANSLHEALLKLVTIRRAAIEQKYQELGHPIIAFLIREANYEEEGWRNSVIASMLMMRYADVLVTHSLEVPLLLPVFTLRQAIYSDPRYAASVKSRLYTCGTPDSESPVLVTTNFALTYYLVSGDISAAKMSCFLLVADTQGMSVLNAVVGRQLTHEVVRDLIHQTRIEEKVAHRKLVIPGLAARLRGDIEDATGWQVIVGPEESSEIAGFLKKTGWTV